MERSKNLAKTPSTHTEKKKSVSKKTLVKQVKPKKTEKKAFMNLLNTQLFFL